MTNFHFFKLRVPENNAVLTVCFLSAEPSFKLNGNGITTRVDGKVMD